MEEQETMLFVQSLKSSSKMVRSICMAAQAEAQVAAAMAVKGQLVRRMDGCGVKVVPEAPVAEAETAVTSCRVLRLLTADT